MDARSVGPSGPLLSHAWRAIAALALMASQTTSPASAGNPALNFVPEIAAASRLNTKTLAIVDTLSYRKHVTGNDGIDPNTPFPSANMRYSFPAGPPCTQTPSIDSCIQIPYPGNTTKIMTLGTAGNAGFTIVDSTGARRLQFALLTYGKADSSGNPHSEWTAQTWYRTSNDGGAHFTNFKQVIASGSGYSAFHPIPGVNIGANGYEFPGDTLVVSSNLEQDVLLPLEITPLNSSGQPIQPPFAVTSYMEVHILRGHWRSDGSDLDWEVGAAANVSMAQSTRGLDETAILELQTNGRCLIVSRGSNQNSPAPVPTGHYWLFQSHDGCRTWDGSGTPLGWDDGSTYYAPAAPPLLYSYGNRVIFMGANADCSSGNCNPSGNTPRTRVVAAELDLTHLTLLKHSAVIVDEKDSFDTNSVDLIYSNRYYLPGTGNLFYYTTRFDSGYCAHLDDACNAAATALTCPPGGNCTEVDHVLYPSWPTNWHLLHPLPSVSPAIRVAANPSITNGIQWPTVPNAQKFLIYARNPSKQNFWEPNGEAVGTATSYVLQGLPAGTVTVDVFAVFPDGTVSSSNQLTLTTH